MTITRPTIVWIVLPRTCPITTDARAIPIVRNRAMIPSVMSIDTEMAVLWAPPATAIRTIPGVT